MSTTAMEFKMRFMRTQTSCIFPFIGAASSQLDAHDLGDHRSCPVNTPEFKSIRISPFMQWSCICNKCLDLGCGCLLQNGADFLILNLSFSQIMLWYRGGGFYPGTGHIKEVGSRDAAGRNVNIPWPRGGFGDADYIAAFDLVLFKLSWCLLKL
jgi:Histone deacetylase domain